MSQKLRMAREFEANEMKRKQRAEAKAAKRGRGDANGSSGEASEGKHHDQA